MDRTVLSRCLQFMAVIGVINKVSPELIRKWLHICNNAGQEIILNCTSSYMILVASAVVGTSDGWTPGLTDCPRNDDNCVQQITQPFQECNYKSICSLPRNIINSDIGNGCQATNYVQIIYDCYTTDIVPTDIVEGQTIAVFPGSNIFGNNVTKRDSYLPSGPQKSWLEVENPLPTGTLENFYFYIHNFTEKGRANVRLQIWRPTADDTRFTLVWQRRVSVELNYANGALYIFDLLDQFQTHQNDRIGFANEQTLGPITFDYTIEHRTLFSVADEATVVGITYDFDSIHLPAQFSIAAKVNPSLSGTTTTTVRMSRPSEESSTQSTTLMDDSTQYEVTTVSFQGLSETTTTTVRMSRPSEETSANVPTPSTTLTYDSTQYEVTTVSVEGDNQTFLVIGLSVLAVIVVAVGITLAVVFYRRNNMKQKEQIKLNSSGGVPESAITSCEDIPIGDYLHTCPVALNDKPHGTGEPKLNRDVSDKSDYHEYDDVKYQDYQEIVEQPNAVDKNDASYNYIDPRGSFNTEGSNMKNEHQLRQVQQQDSIQYDDVGRDTNIQTIGSNYANVYTELETEPKYEHPEMPGETSVNSPGTAHLYYNNPATTYARIQPDSCNRQDQAAR